MRVLLDTSTLIAALIETHPFHKPAFKCLEKVGQKNYKGFVSAHSLAELYAILTRLPVKPPILPNEAQELIKDSVISICEIVSLTSDDYNAVIEHLAQLDIIGGAVYDALIMHVASKIQIDSIITLNEKDFKRVYPEFADKVISP